MVQAQDVAPEAGFLPSPRNQARDAGDGWRLAGIVATPLRWVTGWLFFSAFWRRTVLAPEKLDPNSAAWNGHKMNTFLPHSLGIGNMLEWLVLHPGVMQTFLVVFTIIEALTGLALLLGLVTRLAALGTALLSFGILMGAGWLGTTCLDEWQIGAAGIAGSLTVLLAGAGPWSLDHLWTRKFPRLAQRPVARVLATGRLGRAGSLRAARKTGIVFAAVAILITLATNQALAGGVWGTLHNNSKLPHLALSNATLSSTGDVAVQVYRDGGPDTYGAFIVAVTVVDPTGAKVETFNAQALAKLPKDAIANKYLNKIKPTGHALLVPLGAKADVKLTPDAPTTLPAGTYHIVFTDVSGTSWKAVATVS